LEIYEIVKRGTYGKKGGKFNPARGNINTKQDIEQIKEI
jgi:hypothetical protein